MDQAAVKPSHTTSNKRPDEKQPGCDLTLSIGLWEDASSDADGSSTISEELRAPAGSRRVATVKEEESKPALNLDLTISSSWLA